MKPGGGYWRHSWPPQPRVLIPWFSNKDAKDHSCSGICHYWACFLWECFGKKHTVNHLPECKHKQQCWTTWMKWLQKKTDYQLWESMPFSGFHPTQNYYLWQREVSKYSWFGGIAQSSVPVRAEIFFLPIFMPINTCKCVMLIRNMFSPLSNLR